MAEKACVIYVNAMTQAADDVRVLLETAGYSVCLTEALPNDVVAAQQSAASVTPAIEACLLNAAVKIFLIPAGVLPNELVFAAGLAGKGKGKGRLVAIYEQGATLPEVFNDLANSVVPIGCENLLDAITSQDLWQGPNGEPVPPRTPARVKCQ